MANASVDVPEYSQPAITSLMFFSPSHDGTYGLVQCREDGVRQVMLNFGGSGYKLRCRRFYLKAVNMVTSAADDSVFIEETESEVEDQETDNQDTSYEILVYPADFTLQMLYDRWKAKTLRLPSFQRPFAWNMSTASRLIESFLLNLPVPGIYLYTRLDSEDQLIIDGHQRLWSVFYYFSGVFADGCEFRLTNNIRRQWRGRSFQDLDKMDQLRLASSVLRVTIVRQLNPDDDTSIFHIFERLNTIAGPLTAQEIRDSMYTGRFNDALKDMNRNDEGWRAILGSPEPSPRQRDVELALRLIALYSFESEYRKPMKDFLNSVMGENRDLTDERLQELRVIFRETSRLIVANLGVRPFHGLSGLNAALLDSVAVAFARNLSRIPTDVGERFDELKSDPEFLRTTTINTTDADSVHGRIAMAERILFGS